MLFVELQGREILLVRPGVLPVESVKYGVFPIGPGYGVLPVGPEYGVLLVGPVGQEV